MQKISYGRAKPLTVLAYSTHLSRQCKMPIIRKNCHVYTQTNVPVNLLQLQTQMFAYNMSHCCWSAHGTRTKNGHFLLGFHGVSRYFYFLSDSLALTTLLPLPSFVRTCYSRLIHFAHLCTFFSYFSSCCCPSPPIQLIQYSLRAATFRTHCLSTTKREEQTLLTVQPKPPLSSQ